jgi:hypothetical protein
VSTITGTLAEAIELHKCGELACAGFGGLVPHGAALPPFEVQVSLASLPCVFGTTPETARYDGFKVGIAWQGSPT